MSVTSANASASVAQWDPSLIFPKSQAAKSTGNDAGAATSGAPPAGGGLISAIMEALESIGAGVTSTTGATSDSSSSTTTSATSDTSTSDGASVLKAFQQFFQSLMGALQSQSDGSGESSASSSSSDAAADLQSLIQSLSTASTTCAGDDAANSAVSDLQSSFNNLVSALGGSGRSVSLTGFLQAFASELPSASTVGNVIDTQA